MDYAARWIASLRDQFGSYKEAFAAYNWGPGNVSRWDGRRDSLPSETRHYLDVIMGPGWPEPSDAAPGLSDGQPGGERSGVAGVLGFRVARVGSDRLNLRANPGRGAAVLERLAEGTILEPLGPAQNADDLTWLLTREPGGSEGWAATGFLDVVPVPRRVRAPEPSSEPAPSEPEGQPEGQPATFRVNTDGVRLRGQPGTGLDAPVLAVLHGGELVEEENANLQTADGFTWRQVRVEGQVGWIAIPFLSPVTGPSRRFDPSTATELQVQDWTCSIRSVMWLLKSIGVPVTPAEAQDQMSPAYVNSEVGLLDASGAGIVEVLRDAWGITAFNRAPVSFDDVADWAGRFPVAIGGRNWGHWTAVRGVRGLGDPTGSGPALVLANPGGTGPRFGQQTLNRQQFADLGWFSAVVIPID